MMMLTEKERIIITIIMNEAFIVGRVQSARQVKKNESVNRL